MIRSDYLRIYKSVHTWTGILSGMALFIAFYAGALTVFKQPLEAWANASAPTSMVSMAKTPALITSTLQAHPEAARDFTIHLDADAQAPARMSWSVRAPGAEAHDDSGSRRYTAALDAQGAALVQEIAPSTLGTLIDTLHRVVGLPLDNDPNRWFMGVVSALYALALFSGVVVLLPSLAKDLFALRVGKNLKRMWLDAHNAIGLVSLPFHIVMAVTAVVFAFHDQIYDVQDKLVHGGKWATAFQRNAHGPGKAAPRDPTQLQSPEQLLATARALAPGFVPSQIQYLQVTTPRATVRIWGRDDAAVQPRARGGFIAIEPYSGKVTSSSFLPGRQEGPNLAISSFFALHMAAFGGTLVQVLYLVLGLAGAWLFYSGNLLWIESRRKRAAKGSEGMPAQRLDTRLMAAASIGVCLGSVCGISLAVVGTRWLQGHVAQLGTWQYALYYGSFFAALGWSFARGAARAAVHLLWLAASTTLALPLTSLLAPLLGMPSNHGSSAWAIDATAFLLACGFAWMARASARRRDLGIPDSVWSARIR